MYELLGHSVYPFFMKAKTELLLYQLLWFGDQLTRPTFRNLSATFESWAYSAGLLQTIHRLEDEQFLETQGRSLERVVHLTEKGRQLLADDRNPETEWARDWDGIWRMVIFDIPESKRALRRKLRSTLHANHFGCFQQSVWVSPHPMDQINKIIRKKTPSLGNLTLMESRLISGEKDSDIVANSWDYSIINDNHASYIKHLQGNKKNSNVDHFIAKEKYLWESALKSDPLLPKELIPKGYLGRKAYRLRRSKLPEIMITLLTKPI